MKENILLLGSLPTSDERLILYKKIISTCKKYSNNILSPIETLNFEGNESEKFKRAFETVKWADLIIGEQSEPSTGQGMELREATIHNKKVIIIAKEGSKISGLVKGCPNVQDIIYYSDYKDLENKLNNILLKFKE